MLALAWLRYYVIIFTPSGVFMKPGAEILEISRTRIKIFIEYL
jgi:hypothetical protein